MNDEIIGKVWGPGTQFGPQGIPQQTLEDKIKSLKAALAEVLQFSAQAHEPSCAKFINPLYDKPCNCGAQKAWDMAKEALK